MLCGPLPQGTTNDFKLEPPRTGALDAKISTATHDIKDGDGATQFSVTLCAKRVLVLCHLVATADGRVAASGVHLVILLLREVSAIGRSFTGTGICRQQVVVRRHLAPPSG